MKHDRSVTLGSTIEGGGAILISPSSVQETGSGTSLLSASFSTRTPCGTGGPLAVVARETGRRGHGRARPDRAPTNPSEGGRNDRLGGVGGARRWQALWERGLPSRAHRRQMYPRDRDPITGRGDPPLPRGRSQDSRRDRLGEAIGRVTSSSLPLPLELPRSAAFSARTSLKGRVSMMILEDIQGHDGPAKRAQWRVDLRGHAAISLAPLGLIGSGTCPSCYDAAIEEHSNGPVPGEPSLEMIVELR